MKKLLLILLAALILSAPVGPALPLLSTPAFAQDPVPETIDYATWDKLAVDIEAQIADPEVTETTLETRRAELVTWRDRFQAGQGANDSRLDALRGQLGALGDPPAEGQTEAEEVTNRRQALQAEIAELEVPRKAAVEAYTRADNLIRSIDAKLRERQTDALLEIWPSPINPVNWATAAAAFIDSTGAINAEVQRNLASDFRRQSFVSNLPVILLHLAIAAVILFRGRRWIEQLVRRIARRTSLRGANVFAQILSLGQIFIPVIGLALVGRAGQLSGMTGTRTAPLLQALPWAGFMVFASLWLAARLLPKDDEDNRFLFSPEERTEARVHVVSFGLLLAVRFLIMRMLGDQPPEVISVVSFPLLVIGGLQLFRFGQLLRRHAKKTLAGTDEILFRHRVIQYTAFLCIGIGAVAPLLALVGYVPAATALIYPAAITLALIGFVLFLQGLAADVYVLVTGGTAANRGDLVPVLIGFVIAALAMPVALLVWGARSSDLAEMWRNFRDGFTVGGIQISPTIFTTLVVVFIIGYTITKLLQGTLGASILPKTRLDTGGQRAVVAGIGYVGIFLSAIIAMTTAGINLSSLAILASALSVGIGFGLQNIVQNFVSGVILLIERPISEGDWVQVGSVQGHVRAISVRSTRIETFDRSFVIVPNGDLVAGQVTNFTRYNLTGRLTLNVGVAYGSDTRKVEKILQEIAEAQPMVILNPPPFVGFAGLGSDSLNFQIFCILRDVNSRGSVQKEMLHQIVERFAAEGIEIPFAQRDIWLRNPEALASRDAGSTEQTMIAHDDEAATDTPSPGAAKPVT